MSILQIREAFNGRNFGMEKKRLDVGHLLDTLTCLIDKDKGIILDFYENIFLKKSVIEDRQLLSKLKELLEDFFKVLFSS